MHKCTGALPRGFESNSLVIAASRIRENLAASHLAGETEWEVSANRRPPR